MSKETKQLIAIIAVRLVVFNVVRAAIRSSAKRAEAKGSIYPDLRAVA